MNLNTNVINKMNIYIHANQKCFLQEIKILSKGIISLKFKLILNQQKIYKKFKGNRFKKNI